MCVQGYVVFHKAAELSTYDPLRSVCHPRWNSRYGVSHLVVFGTSTGLHLSAIIAHALAIASAGLYEQSYVILVLIVFCDNTT
jgi:hypothetical protein